MPMASEVMPAAMMAAMMVAMMLPSVTPTLWRHHRHLRATRMPRAGQRTMLFAAGYASVWAAIGLALFATSAALSPMGMASPADPPVAPWAAGAVVLCAGALQRSRWKAKQLLRCREACAAARGVPRFVISAWRDGCRLGVACALSCAAPMAVLFVTGLMNARMMVAITAAITAERLAPAGARIARLTGTLALAAGSAMCVRAIGLAMSGGA
jgi:predicted metal-binding membrane protein